MLTYIVDAFNLIYNIPALKKSQEPHKELLWYIKKYNLTGSKNNKVIIVFDGYPKRDLVKELNFEIVFSEDKTADFVIEGLLKKFKNKSTVFVVSDDTQIRSYTKREGANILCLGDFLKTKKAKKTEENKEISCSLQKEITEELRKIWIKEE